MADSMSVNADSQPAVTDKSAPPHQGKDGVTDGRTMEQVMSENKRKGEEIATLKSAIEAQGMELSQLKELAAQGALNKRGKERMEDLEDDLDRKVAQLEEMDEAKPYLHASKKYAEQAKSSATLEVMTELANDYLEDQAESLGIELKELIKELSPYAIKYSNLNPYARNKKALRDYKVTKSKLEDISKREQELRKKEEQEKAFREGRGRVIVDESSDQKFSKASPAEQKRLLAEKQRQFATRQ